MDNQQPLAQPPAAATPQLGDWNWGAAGLTWIWGIRFNVWLALIAFVPYVGGIWWIVLGLKGNEWAWKARPWTSVDEFNRAMAPWNMWGKIFFIVSLILPFVFIAWVMAFFSAASVTNTVY